MAVIMNALWNDAGTIIPVGQAKYVVAEQPIAEYDNWINYNLVTDIQAVIDDVINRFNANTILKADSDNTPAALTVAEQTLVGRKTGGSIDALVVADVLTMLDVESGAGVSLLEEVTNVLREKSSGGYDNDFVIGSPQLADDGNSAHDYRMWFDKSKGAFRAGGVAGNLWNDSNVGDHSFACGCDTKASGEASFAEGDMTRADGNCSHAEGADTLSSGYASHAEGQISEATGNSSHAEGVGTLAFGDYSHAEGRNTITNSDYAHADGYYSDAYMVGQYAKSCGRFTATGDAQYSNIVARRATTDASQSELTLDGGTPDSASRIILPANRTWAFTISIAARQTSGSGTVGDSGIYKIEGGIKRDGSNNTALVGVITKTVLAEDQSVWDVTAEADDTNECLVIKVTGEASKTIHWVAKADLVEVG